MLHRILGLAATAAIATVSTVALAAPAHAADPIRNCGPAPADKDGSAWGYTFAQNNEPLYRSASTGSTRCALGQRSHRADYHCYTTGSDGYTWTYVRDVDSTYAGWVRDDRLTDYGSLVRC